MSKKLYKYSSPSYIEKIFPSNEIAVLKYKCSYPKDFNDPYELFLTLNSVDVPEVLAFYSDVIGEIPQIPTTCFSRSPSIVPMWAHYAQNLQGFVIELDEKKLSSHFPRSGLGDVNYREGSDDSIRKVLIRAYGTAKPRHSFLLQKAVFSAAYLTKNSYWSYEKECRMIVDPVEIKESDGIILIDIPMECVDAIICGPRAGIETRKILNEQAKRINCNYFEMKIGHHSPIPFFLDNTGNPYIFDKGKLTASINYCTKCKEPIKIDAKECSWCKINEAQRTSAAERNPYRTLARYGLLESYIDEMDKVGLKRRKK